MKKKKKTKYNIFLLATIAEGRLFRTEVWVALREQEALLYLKGMRYALGWLLPCVARSAFFDEKCYNLKGRCTNSCERNEELVALCQKALKCCLILQPCLKRKKKKIY
ncbi:uncharacterized protein LOC109461034 [Rhinolophus sinicus]|uniref:uncharacterized protein LOC109461034 n=1 Tax=Rhinolophus sinicus TaxID=89399 RepID=UPI003D7AC995